MLGLFDIHVLNLLLRLIFFGKDLLVMVTTLTLLMFTLIEHRPLASVSLNHGRKLVQWSSLKWPPLTCASVLLGSLNGLICVSKSLPHVRGGHFTEFHCIYIRQENPKLNSESWICLSLSDCSRFPSEMSTAIECVRSKMCQELRAIHIT